MPGIATVPVKLTANALVSTPGMDGVKPLMRVLLPLKPSLVSLMRLGLYTCCNVYTTFCGTPVSCCVEPGLIDVVAEIQSGGAVADVGNIEQQLAKNLPLNAQTPLH